ncbi:MAG TPA: hypothetical protein VLA16_23380, partial [Ideonella sp.]|nr:hypothetical protein [Ideonella sp.]
MAQYKGVQVSGELAGLLRHMDEVDEHREALQMLQGAWDNLSMLGELSGMGVQIGGVRSAFGQLTPRLLNHLGEQALRKAGLALQAQGHVAIDILVRNLFERTADIGFLATDHELRRHAEADEEQRRSGQAALIERLREYRRNYSVYDDVVLLAPDGSVLARLDQRFGAAHSRDAWVGEALACRQPYFERYGATDLRPGAGPSLIYACPVLAADGRRPVALLALCFDLADECRRIFAALGAHHADGAGWTVIALLDAAGTVIASSDALQLPPGAGVGLGALEAEPGDRAGAAGGARVLRFGGRRWLALSCAAQPYQGYAGPGWYGHAMVPLEHAFESATDGGAPDEADGCSLQQLPAPVQAALMASPQLFSEALRDIAPSAGGIEAELKRTVWNGNVALGAQPPGRDAQFSRALLREIGRTGARTRDVFTRAIANMNRTVVSAMVEDSRARAALAIDIMDRNLYERANDCRWWALTPLFREALAAPAIDAAMQTALTGVLKTIHGLYTVYANLLLFDRQGKVVAVSRADAEAEPGRLLGQDWVRQCLALADPHAYGVSPYEPSALYGGELTCIYAAAVRAPGDARRVVGGIAIVFDAGPQFQAMLVDSVAGGGGFGAFVEPGGRVVASSRADLPPGSLLPAELLPAGAAEPAAVGAVAPTGSPAGARVVSFEQQLYAL